MIKIERKTKETSIELQLCVNSSDPQINIDTGLPFLDHMLDQLASHGGWESAHQNASRLKSGRSSRHRRCGYLFR